MIRIPLDLDEEGSKLLQATIELVAKPINEALKTQDARFVFTALLSGVEFIGSRLIDEGVYDEQTVAGQIAGTLVDVVAAPPLRPEPEAPRVIAP